MFLLQVEALREASQLYCLCRRPYDPDRPMLSCDYCSDWFHYDCIGLDAPSTFAALYMCWRLACCVGFLGWDRVAIWLGASCNRLQPTPLLQSLTCCFFVQQHEVNVCRLTDQGTNR